jgi:methylated-DNA-[protein]-cysteine S-methyltransferase
MAAVEAQVAHYTEIESPLGPLLLVADESGLREINFVNGRHAVSPDPSWQKDDAQFRDVTKQLNTYFAGDLEVFDLKLAPRGTPFQLEVWKKLCDIPFGETISYGE